MKSGQGFSQSGTEFPKSREDLDIQRKQPQVIHEQQALDFSHSFRSHYRPKVLELEGGFKSMHSQNLFIKQLPRIEYKLIWGKC